MLVLFNEEEILKLHDCLKEINITSRIYKKRGEEMDYYIDSIGEVLNKLDKEEQLAVHIFMVHDSLLDCINSIEM